jgi:molybdopterin molybdotransferase
MISKKPAMPILSASDALKTILEAVHPQGTIAVSLERGLGYALAENVISEEDIPPFDNSAMDGYAFRHDDILHLPVVLRLVAEIGAGTYPEVTLKSGEAVSIMTGARIPQGCDAVVQREWTEPEGKDKVRILRSAPPGHNVAKGNEGLQRGCVLRPQEIGVLASLGRTQVTIFRPPSVALLTTGDEIVAIDQPLAESKVRNSNAYALRALVEELGCDVRDLGIARDDREELSRKIEDGLSSDVLITSGGVSVGRYDLVKDTVEELGVSIMFWKVNIKPGMPLLFGMAGERPVFGLPGNPVSSMVTFVKFVRPALLKMLGHKNVEPRPTLRAKLEESIQKADGKRHFLRGILDSGGGALTVRLTGPQSSHILTSMVKANCLVIIPEDVTHADVGDTVEVELL